MKLFQNNKKLKWQPFCLRVFPWRHSETVTTALTSWTIEANWTLACNPSKLFFEIRITEVIDSKDISRRKYIQNSSGDNQKHGHVSPQSFPFFSKIYRAKHLIVIIASRFAIAPCWFVMTWKKLYTTDLYGQLLISESKF